MRSSYEHLPIAKGRGSVSQAPNLPEGFADTFTSRFVDIGDLRVHAVVGGDGRRCCSCTAGPRPGTRGGW